MMLKLRISSTGKGFFEELSGEPAVLYNAEANLYKYAEVGHLNTLLPANVV
jgi:hypothetical protein